MTKLIIFMHKDIRLSSVKDFKIIINLIFFLFIAISELLYDDFKTFCIYRNRNRNRNKWTRNNISYVDDIKKKDITLMRLGYRWNIMKYSHFEVSYEMKTLRRSFKCYKENFELILV
jgi:hypothetical protein